jgi:plastocyanin
MRAPGTRRIIPAVALATAALALAGCGSSDESSSDTTAPEETTATGGSGGDTIAGSVGPGFEISVDMTSLAPGSYTLTVDDQATSHNFHLTGPDGVDVSTDVGGTGSKSFEVTLEAGTYTFVCDPHASSMNGTITVG